MKSQSIPDPTSFDTSAAFHGFVQRAGLEDPRETLWEEKIRPLCVYTILRFRRTVDLRDYLDELKIFDALLAAADASSPGPRFRANEGKDPVTDPKLKRTQVLLSKTRKWLHLPPLGKGSAKGADYELAMQRWRDANGDPTDEMILNGWRPRPVSYADLRLDPNKGGTEKTSSQPVPAPAAGSESSTTTTTARPNVPPTPADSGQAQPSVNREPEVRSELPPALLPKSVTGQGKTQAERREEIAAMNAELKNANGEWKTLKPVDPLERARA